MYSQIRNNCGTLGPAAITASAGHFDLVILLAWIISASQLLPFVMDPVIARSTSDFLPHNIELVTDKKTILFSKP